MIRMIRMIILFRNPRLGPRISSPGRQRCRRPPRRLEVLKTLQFPLFSRPAALLFPLSEIFLKVPTTGQIVCFSWEISMVGAILCSRLQPQPHCGRGTVQNHPMDHPTCFSPLNLRVQDSGEKCINRSCLLYTSPSPRDRG